MPSADTVFMQRALFHAARGAGRTSPNPLVGAVVVSPDGVVLGQGFHERAGEPHAEVRALEAAGDRARGATLYCTLEPCCHHGRTGPCVERIVDAAVARVVVATEDPDPRVRGQGFRFLRARGVHLEVGLCAAAATELNQPFFTLMREGRPFVVMKMATSLDGRLAERPGRRTRLTSVCANRHAHRVRAAIDAVGVGANTILIDDPELTARGVYRERPLIRVVFDRRLRTPPAARVLSTLDAGPVIIVTTPDGAARTGRRRALDAAGAEVVTARDGTIAAALERLGERQIGSLLLEGGATVQAAAWDEGVVDFARLYVTPHVVGPGGVSFVPVRTFSSAALIGRRVEPLGPDILIEGYVHRPR
jgi:diaminohydroxyphosphoribosylaminopyrimidine deaminase / 5-amino-6-(5-phosphoribosylamino)uracil reductase